ncbi:MAG: condensation domain-containing protein, partial [Paraglaciecola sp.]|nr:condensation domain-containing protein [Paraglaciecola sp.]
MMGKASFPLTLSQQDIYFDQLHYPQSPLYNVGGYISILNLDEQRLQDAHRRLISQHQAFGIRIVQSHQRAAEQYISDIRSAELPLIDFSQHCDSESQARHWLQQLFETPIDFIDTELYRAYLLKISANHYWYVGFAHHLCMDGWGFANWANRLGRLYNDLDEPNHSALTWQDVSDKDQNYLSSAKFHRDLAFWAEQCNQFPQKPLEPLHQFRSQPHTDTPSVRISRVLSSQQYQSIQQAATAFGVTVNQILVALLAVYFERFHQAADLVFGMPAHNRQGHDQKQMIGIFTSISPLRVLFDSTLSFRALCQQLLTLQKKVFRHQRAPIGQIAAHLGIKDALYDISVNYLKLDSQLLINGHQAELVYLSHHHEITPITFTLWEYGKSHQLELMIDYRRDYFDDADIQRMFQ